MYKLNALTFIPNAHPTPLDLEKSGERACCFNRNKYGKLKSKTIQRHPLTPG